MLVLQHTIREHKHSEMDSNKYYPSVMRFDVRHECGTDIFSSNYANVVTASSDIWPIFMLRFCSALCWQVTKPLLCHNKQYELQLTLTPFVQSTPTPNSCK